MWSCKGKQQTIPLLLCFVYIYINERQMMMQSLQQIGYEQSVHNLLYGDITYSVDKNTTAFVII